MKDRAEGGISAERRQTLDNPQAILSEAGATLDDAASCTVRPVDLSEFAEMNWVYAVYFKVMALGRSTVQVVALPSCVRIEITVTAAR